MLHFRLILAALLAALAAAGSAASDGMLNVRDYGAVGDGKADDTTAIRAALNAAKSGPKGSGVILPPGQYRVTGTLTIENALLSGLAAGGWPADRGPMPTLLVDFTDGPCIHARDASSVHGISFEYDHKGEKARKFGPAVLLSGNGISLTNLRIHQPYEGIMADGVSNIGRLNIENVFIISARQCGVYVTQTYDIPTLRNVEVWNLADYSLDHCVGFKLGKNDEIRMDNCFAFKCKIGFQFVKEEQGATWGGMTGCSADFSIEGIVMVEVNSLRLNGGSLWGHATSLRVQGPGRVVVCGADLRANGAPALIARGCRSLTVTGCALGKSGSSWPHVPTARLESGENVLINGCSFDAFGPGIVIDEQMTSFSISNNVFAPSRFEAIADNSGPDSRKVIANNLIQKAGDEASP